MSVSDRSSLLTYQAKPIGYHSQAPALSKFEAFLQKMSQQKFGPKEFFERQYVKSSNDSTLVGLGRVLALGGIIGFVTSTPLTGVPDYDALKKQAEFCEQCLKIKEIYNRFTQQKNDGTCYQLQGAVLQLHRTFATPTTQALISAVLAKQTGVDIVTEINQYLVGTR